MKFIKLAVRTFLILFVIAFLVAISLPNFVTSCGRAPASSVKGNMHTWQTMLETYAVDWGGQYPINVLALKKEAEEKKYWKTFKNPFGVNSPSYSDMDENLTKEVSYFFYIEKGKGIAGAVYYEPIRNSDKTITKYYVYGAGKEGKLLEDKGSPLYLTNN